jgi:predicted nucleic acid-binding protein
MDLLASLELVDIDALVLDRAAQPMPTEIGTLDAIHLATALLWKAMTHTEVVMATHDTALAVAAHAHGLPVVGVVGLASG